MVMDKYTILCTELRGSAQSLNGNIETLQNKADKLQKAINKVTRGDYKSSDLSSAYTAQSALTGGITRLGEICGAMNTAALQFAEASTELSGRANLTAYYMQHTDTLDYSTLMGNYSAAIISAGSAAAGYELIKKALSEKDYQVDSLGSVSNAVQDALTIEKANHISTYEKQNPDIANKLNAFLSNAGLSDTDIENIKYLIYAAPMPYQTIYLQNISRYSVGEGNQTAYSGLFNRVLLKDPAVLSTDPRGAYTSFFHESGHAIDDTEKITGSYTEKYAYEGECLFNLITQDVRNNISRYIDSHYAELSIEEKKIIMRSMNLTDDADFIYTARDKTLSDDRLNGIRTEILDYYYDVEMVGYENEVVCDIYGGITNEVFYKESDEIHLDHLAQGENYWYNNEIIKGVDLGFFKGNYDIKTGEFRHSIEDQAGTQAAELWAEFFAAQMTCNEAALANIKEHFPTAYEAMEQMAQDMANS